MTTALRRRVKPNLDSQSVVGSAREMSALRSVALASFLEGPQLERLHFPSTRVRQRRLRALVDHELLAAHLQGEALHRPNVYTLTRKGRECLVETGAFPLGLPKRCRLPRSQKLRHALAVRDVFVEFIRAERNRKFALRSFRFEADLAGEPIFQAARLIPDALADVEGEGERFAIGIEVDMGTESGVSVLTPKFEVWRRVLGSIVHGGGGKRTVLLALGPTMARVATLRRSAEKAGLALDADVFCLTFAQLPGVLAEGYPHEVYAPGVRAVRTGGGFQPLDKAPKTAMDGVAFRPLGGRRS